MVLEALTKAGQGGLGFALAFLHESLSQSGGAEGSAPRPWVVVEGPDDKYLFVGGFPRELRVAVREKRIFWLRVSREDALPEFVQILLESGLCEGVLLRGFERFDSAHKARVWMRRWQLKAEKSGTHLVWVHERACEVLGVNVRVEWDAPGKWKLLKGEGLLESSPFHVIRSLQKPLHPTNAAASTTEAATATTANATRRDDADRTPARIA